MNQLRSLVLLALATVPSAQEPPHDPGLRQAFPRSLHHLYAVTREGFGPGPGELIGLEGPPRWREETLASTDGGLRLCAFGSFLYAVNADAGTITRVRRDGRRERTYDLGAASRPQDVLVHRGEHAWVTRLEDPRLARLHLPTGELTESVDLGVLAEENEAVALRSMIRDGARLFVQVGLTQLDGKMVGATRGLLAVVDLETATLVDVDPHAPGIQGIELLGAPPVHRMQIVEATRTLFVSTTLHRLDNRGGIEMVDLERLAPLGYALSEDEVGADLGGFVMTSPEAGYFVFHTDIVASTHLKPFTLAGGAEPGPELLVLLGDFVDVLTHDPERRRLYLPSGFSWQEQGVWVLDTATDELVTPGPIPTLQRPHDLVLAR